ncbi:MAG: universal stress protein [Proteobacteria bacterium]|nr:universal stress protein [Pseudomonadota bacterium]
MDMYASVVCGIDGSEASLHAFRQVLGRMSAGGSLAAVAVLPREILIYDATAEVLDRLEKQRFEVARNLQAHLDTLTAEASAKGVELTVRLISEGRPYERLVEYANQANASLIVMGARNAGQLQRRLVGSTTSRVIGTAGRNVLLIPEGVPLNDGPVLAPTDGSAYGTRAIEVAAQQASQSGQPLLIVSVAAMPEGAENDPMSSLRSELSLEEARKWAESALSIVEPLGVKAKVFVLSNEPYAAIAKAAKDHGAGFIVMGSHGRTGLSHLLMDPQRNG